jgi:hypothetical protein
MPVNLWSAPPGPLKGGASIAQNTFTAARDIPSGEEATSFYTIPGNTLQEGSQIEIYAWGVASNTGTPTLILGVYYGLVAGVALAVSAAKTTTTAMSNWPWELWYEGRVTNTGLVADGKIMGKGRWRLPTSATAWTEFHLPESAPAVVAIDTTVDKKISIGATWSASSASNTITCHQCRVIVHG